MYSGRSKAYGTLGREVAAPVQGTVDVAGPNWNRRHYRVGREIAAPTPNCIQIKSSKGTLDYETGTEIDAPTDTSRSFTIQGKVHHFATANLS